MSTGPTACSARARTRRRRMRARSSASKSSGRIVACGAGVDAMACRRRRVCARRRAAATRSTASRRRHGACRFPQDVIAARRGGTAGELTSPSGTTSSTAAGSRRARRSLVHGGSSGIGLTAIQLAKQFGATVFATAGSPTRSRSAATIGADHAIDYKTQDFVAEVARITGKRGVDVVLDTVGGDYIARNLRCLATDGRLVMIGFLQGQQGRDRLPLPHGEAADDHRFDAARVTVRAQGRAGEVARGERVAALRERQAADRDARACSRSTRPRRRMR